MRRLVTWLVVAALVALALFAARDALRGDGRAAPPPATTTGQSHAPVLGPPPSIPARAELATRLKAMGARGALYLTDATCRRFVIVLPALRWTTENGLPGADCGPWAHPPALEGSGIAARQVDAETIEVTSGGWGYRFEGLAPAFKPDGTLTFIRDGRLYEWTARCPPTAKIVEFEGLHAVPRCVREIEGAPRSMQEVAWLTDRDYAAIAGPQGAASVLVEQNGKEERLFTGVGTRVGALQVSPGGRYLAARLDGALVLFQTGSAGTKPLPATGDDLIRAITWSQDDGVAALATERAIDIFPAGRRRPVVELPISAAKIQWR
ncbi:MAG TPA: hypothetical protein VH281_00200 [Gaiellaceae bacterium]|jgi:hypothetical protein